MTDPGPPTDPTRTLLMLMGSAVVLALTGIFWAITSHLTGPLVNPYLHLIPLLLGLSGLGLFAGLRRLGSRVRTLLLLASVAGSAWVDGLLLLVNQVADGGRPKLVEVKLHSAEHLTMTTGRRGNPFQGTRNLVVTLPGAPLGKKHLGRAHLRGFYPAGSTLRLSVYPGALGFPWVDKAEPISP